MFFPFTLGWRGRSVCQIWSWLPRAITYVSKFGLPAQCTRLADLGSRMSELFSCKSSIIWQFLQCSERRQACQLVENLLPIFSPFLSRSKGKLMLESGGFLRHLVFLLCQSRGESFSLLSWAVVELGSYKKMLFRKASVWSRHWNKLVEVVKGE